MLIVVVIIGILAAAILPRLTGYLAKTRDMKRQVDLRNVAAAIERYKDEKGEFPIREVSEDEKNFFNGDPISLPNYGYCSALSNSLGDYLMLPRDPSGANQICLHIDFYWFPSNVIWHQRAEKAAPKGEYLYQRVRKGGERGAAATLIAKVETPEAANYVLIDKKHWHPRGGAFQHPRSMFTQPHAKKAWDISNIKLCTSVEKVQEGGEAFQVQVDGKVICKYSNSEQLYYILKIE